MKKMLFVGVTAGLALAAVLIMTAGMSSPPPEKNMGASADRDRMMEKHEMMEREHHEGWCMMSPKGHMMMPCPMHGMMMEKLLEPKMVATADGGIAVMAYGKLTKYDKDMNMVKEVEMKPDHEAMKKMMTEMMESCPMCKHMGEKMEKGEHHGKPMMHEMGKKGEK